MRSKSLAARTRDAVREEPFLHDALRAGVLNYTAAARYVDVDGEHDAIATALRRYADELSAYDSSGADARVSMQSGIGRRDDDATDGDADDRLLAVGEAVFDADGGGHTAILTTGAVDAGLLRRVLGRLSTADVAVAAAGVTGEALVVVVERRVGADALRAVESVVEA